ncbi:hypothetical protein EZE58_04095 [Brevibacterium sp. LS14]|nr:hypothetical protein [Brevibacterium sp. LS14]
MVALVGRARGAGLAVRRIGFGLTLGPGITPRLGLGLRLALGITPGLGLCPGLRVGHRCSPRSPGRPPIPNPTRNRRRRPR